MTSIIPWNQTPALVLLSSHSPQLLSGSLDPGTAMLSEEKWCRHL